MSGRGFRLPRHLVTAILASVLAAVALYPFCGFVFRCGCTAMWLGAAAHCNVHRPAGPHCPWCEHLALGTAGFLLTLAFQLLVYLPLFRRSRSEPAAGFAALVAFPAAALLAAFLTWLPTDYPHFLGRGARGALGLPDGPVRCVRPAPPPPRTAETPVSPGAGGSP
jgi:hypothetical protein